MPISALGFEPNLYPSITGLNPSSNESYTYPAISGIVKSKTFDVPSDLFIVTLCFPIITLPLLLHL